MISGIVMYNNKPGHVLRANPPPLVWVRCLASDLPLISYPLIRKAIKRITHTKNPALPSRAPLDTNVISAHLKRMSLPLDEFTWAGSRGDEHHSTPENSFQISLKYQIIFSLSIALEE